MTGAVETLIRELARLTRRVEQLETREGPTRLTATTTWDPALMAAGAAVSTTVTVTGAAVDDVAIAQHDQIGANDVIVSAFVQAADTVRVVLRNETGGNLDVASGTLRVDVLTH